MPKLTDEELEAQRPEEDAPESEWKKWSRIWEERAKAQSKDAVSPEELAELRATAQRAQELEDAQKSELEKALARAEKAEKALSEREKADSVRKLADEVAKEKGVPASALRGATREELEAHAEEILALLPEKPKGATDGTGGDRGDDIDEEEADAKEIAAAIRL